MNKATSTSQLPVPLPGSQPESGQWRSMVFSFGLHLLLLSFFFWFTYSSGGGGDSTEADRSAGIVLTVESTVTQEQEYLDQETFEASEAFAETVSSSASNQPTQEAAPEIESMQSLREIELPGFESNSSNDAAQMTTPAAQGFQASTELSEAARDIMAADQERFDALKPAGPATSLSVFGSGQMEGRSFLFLLDRSTSMGSKGLGVVQVARKELTAAVEKLDPHHQFQVLGYNNTTTPMKAARLLRASKENKLEVPQFIGHLTAFGPTDHITGIMTAISYRPDVLVLLTDGGSPELNEQQLKKVRSASRGKTQIHCVQFGIGTQPVAENFMGELAAQNGGTFRYINVNDWHRK